MKKITPLLFLVFLSFFCQAQPTNLCPIYNQAWDLGASNNEWINVWAINGNFQIITGPATNQFGVNPNSVTNNQPAVTFGNVVGQTWNGGLVVTNTGTFSGTLSNTTNLYASQYGFNLVNAKVTGPNSFTLLPGATIVGNGVSLTNLSNLTWGSATNYTTADLPVQAHLYVSNSIPMWFVIRTNTAN